MNKRLLLLAALAVLSFQVRAVDTIIDSNTNAAETTFTNTTGLGWHNMALTTAYLGNSLRSFNNGAWCKLSAPALTTGSYDVYMYWPNYVSAPDNSNPVAVQTSTTLETVAVNQLLGGGQWNLLGRWTLNNTASVMITNTGNGNPGTTPIFCDAVKFVPVATGTLPDLTVTAAAYSAGAFTSTIANTLGTAATAADTPVTVDYAINGVRRATHDSYLGPLGIGATQAIGVSTPPYVPPPGSYTLTATVDSGNTHAELTETNNTFSTALTVSVPTPLVALTSDFATVDVGGDVLLSWSSTGVDVCLASGGPMSGGWSGGKATFGEELVPGLTESVNFALDCVKSDAKSDVNVGVTSQTLPNLIVTAASHTGTAFTSTVKNIGTVETPSGVAIQVAYSVDGVVRANSTATMGPLAPQASVVVAASSPAYAIPNGTHVLLADVDSTNLIPEDNETDNELFQDITVSVGPPPVLLSDLIVESVSYAGGAFTSIIRNIGTGPTPSGGPQPGFQLIDVSWLVDNVQRGFNHAIPGPMAPGASQTVVSTSAPFTIPPGSYTIQGFVDDSNRFPESNETNNRFSAPLVIGTPPPPLPANAFRKGINANQFIAVGNFDATSRLATKDLGATSIRVAKHGLHTEAINWASANGVKVLFFTGYGQCRATGSVACTTAAGRQAYADMVGADARLHGTKVEHYEIYNEWNGAFTPNGITKGSALSRTAYADLLCRSYRAVKAVNPALKVVGGATDGTDIAFMTAVLNAGGENCIDAWSVHPYVFTPKTFSVGAGGTAAAGIAKFIEAMTAVDAAIRNATGRSIPILVTEDGRLNGIGAASYAVTANYITGIYNWAKTSPFMGGIWYYALEADPARYGLINQFNNALLQPQYNAFKAITLP